MNYYYDFFWPIATSTAVTEGRARSQNKTFRGTGPGFYRSDALFVMVPTVLKQSRELLLIQQVCSQPHPWAVNTTLSTFAAERHAAISWLPGPQQQTQRSGNQMMGQTDRQTLDSFTDSAPHTMPVASYVSCQVGNARISCCGNAAAGRPAPGTNQSISPARSLLSSKPTSRWLLSVECSSIICSFCAITAAVPSRPQDGTVSVIVLFTIASSCVTDCNF